MYKFPEEKEHNTVMQFIPQIPENDSDKSLIGNKYKTNKT